MTDHENVRGSRRGILRAIASLGVVAAAPIYADAPGFLRRAGDARQVRLRSQRTGESVNTLYYVNGAYIQPALDEISYFMRDWREDSYIPYDARNVDIIATMMRLMDTEESLLVVSGYRSPRTNAMLAARSGGVARNSFHMRGMAADVQLQSRTPSQIASAALACNGGGVGRYRSFVHVDCGPIRCWRG